MRDQPHLRAETEELIFTEALALPADVRRAFIEGRCGEDAAAAGRVLTLLDGYQEGSAFLDVPAPEAVLRLALDADVVSLPEPAAGDRIGRYRLLEQIGEGGFGVVYLAEQQEPVRRRVALKLIRLGMDTREFIARFEAERQALALMDHPNIARVFDAGATEAGRPFFVMELVRGVPITRYCDDHRVPTAERLRLFMAVCQAVQHAHQKGVIHRDLKPSNILVALHDGVPVPKVIDFGIAKAVREPLTDKTLFTRLHTMLGTPAYTSPEQMEMSGLDVDTRSDIYSLGVLLYELLTGRPPFDPAALAHSGLDAMRRTIREVDPPRPSARLGTLAEADRAAIAQQRGTDALKLSGLLRGDLDWIVMRCLEKDRTRRYATASDLAADIERHLHNDLVTARPASGAYRMRKFVRRHKLGVIATAAVAAALTAGLIASSILLVRERAAAEKSRHVAQFMKDMLGGVGPSVARGRDTTLLREVLDATIRRLDTELRDQPEVAADLRHTLGVAFHAIGDYDQAATLWRDAVAARRTLGDRDSVQLAATLHELGSMLWRMNQVAAAESALQEALAIRRKALGPDHFDVGTTLAALGHIIGSHRFLPEREALLLEAVAIQRKHPGHDDDEFAETLAILGYVLNSINRYDEAQAALRESVAIRERLFGDLHPHVADALASLAASYGSSEKRGEELALRRRVLLINRQVRGPAHAKLIEALLHFTSGRLPADTLGDDLRLAREVVGDLGQALPKDSPDLAVAQLALAAALDLEPGNSAEADSLARDAVERIRRAREEGVSPHRDTSTGMQAFALRTLDADRLRYALPMAEELKADAEFGSILTYGPPITRTLGFIYFDLGRFAEATALLETTVRSPRGLWRPAQRAMVFIDYACLGDAYREMGRLSDSRQILEQGLSRTIVTGEEFDPAQVARAAVRGELGYTAMAEGRFAEAEGLFRQALQEYEAAPAVNRWDKFRPRGRVLSGLGQALAAQGKFAEAEPLVVDGFSELMAKRETFFGDRTRMLRETLEAVVQLYRAWGKPDKAAEWEQKLAAL